MLYYLKIKNLQKNMNISIMMSVGCQNLWDELILKNEIKLFREKYWIDTKFSVFTYDIKNIFYKDKNIKYLEYFPIWIRNPKNILRNIKNYFNFVKTIRKSDKVVIGWWGIMFDNESGNFSNPLNSWLFRSKFIKIMKKDLIFFWVSIDIKNRENLEKIKKIFSLWNEVYVRDDASFKLLKDLWVSSQIILDPVFYDNWEEGIKNYKKSFMIKKVEAKTFSMNDLKEIDFSWKIVWLALRSWYLKDENIFIKQIIGFITNSNWKVILLPHSFHEIDDVANDLKFLNQFIKSKVEIKEDMEKVYDVYKNKQIDFCFSMRLHSMILSQVYAIPFIGIKYSQKWDLM